MNSPKSSALHEEDGRGQSTPTSPEVWDESTGPQRNWGGLRRTLFNMVIKSLGSQSPSLEILHTLILLRILILFGCLVWVPRLWGPLEMPGIEPRPPPICENAGYGSKIRLDTPLRLRVKESAGIRLRLLCFFFLCLGVTINDAQV